ncbi:serine/threonine kinase 22 substrate 1, isoform CRA_a [Rattus norvegicus]|uniref:Serine/threonine kinase 22 substrate 1, isoform CRA_a n=1 Tax=Rattus norvegicus TaxID=10116 RepID=A6JAU5_RAT|nr:serine/threonine kinase 22 substrate 1, isoform CRA_a [Rattus norvegicus]
MCQPGAAVIHGVPTAAAGTCADPTGGRSEAEGSGSCLPQLPEATQEDSGAGAPGLGQTRQGRGPELHPSAGPRRSRSGQEPTADGQDEAGVRTEAEGMGGGEKVATLDYMHLKMCSLHDQLSHLPLEGSTGAMGGGSTGGAPPKRGGPGSEQ